MTSERAVEAAWTNLRIDLSSVFHDDEKLLDHHRPLIEAAMVAATPAPRENGWEELRREIEALPDQSIRGDGNIGRHLVGRNIEPAQSHVRIIGRAAVLAIVSRLAAARGEPPEPGPAIDWAEALARYVLAHGVHSPSCAYVERAQTCDCGFWEASRAARAVKDAALRSNEAP